MKTVIILSFCVAISLLASIALAQTGSGEGITAITIPSADITLSFLQPGKIDLLSALMHELGHVIGLDDLDPQEGSYKLMTSVLASGVRRIHYSAKAKQN